MNFGTLIHQGLALHSEMEASNKEKIQEAIDSYWEACNLPRKQKKLARKKANQEYRFWKRIDAWYSETFNFM